MRLSKRLVFLLASVIPLPALLYCLEAPREDLKKGQDLFERRCTGCHRLDEQRVGPRLRNVFAKPAAAQPDFPYSDALKASRLYWNEATLDRWLADPEALVPNNDMAFRVSAAAERAAIIAYLKSTSAP